MLLILLLVRRILVLFCSSNLVGYKRWESCIDFFRACVNRNVVNTTDTNLVFSCTISQKRHCTLHARRIHTLLSSITYIFAWITTLCSKIRRTFPGADHSRCFTSKCLWRKNTRAQDCILGSYLDFLLPNVWSKVLLVLAENSVILSPAPYSGICFVHVDLLSGVLSFLHFLPLLSARSFVM